MNGDPTRWLDDGEAPRGARLALEEAEQALPSAAELASLEAKLAPLLGGPSGGGPSGGDGGAPLAIPRPPLGGFAIAAGAVAVIGALGVALLVASDVEPRAAPPPVATAELVDAGPETIELTDAGVAAIERDPAPERPRAPVRSRVDAGEAVDPTPPAETPPPETPPEAADATEEIALIRDAGRALRSDPARALALTREHEARFPSGSFQQDRERIAIEALVRSGARPAAVERANRFFARFPSSPLRPRVEAILAD
jgi:hypothetical protein